MVIEEVQQDIFALPDNYYLAQCISSDYATNSGISIDFQRRFNLRTQLNRIGNHKFPDCILIGRVFNLVTKEKYFNKPTYIKFTRSIRMMKDIIVANNIKYLGIYRLGCCRDKLKWDKVKKIIEDEFKDVDIHITVCNL